MVDVQSFVLNLPSFIERSYFISPGIVSVIFKVIWSIFTFLVVTTMIQYGFASIGIRSSPATENKQKSLWHAQREYSQVQSISNGRWGDMLFNLPSIRIILGLLFWLFIYAFELLFSLSIDNAYITHYNGTNCIGRIADYKMMANSMWDPSYMYASSSVVPTNSTLLRQLINQKQVGNFALLGDGIFTISPVNALYSKGQRINVSRTGLNCTSTIPFKRTDTGLPYRLAEDGSTVVGNISTEHFFNFPVTSFDSTQYAYINLALTSTNYTAADISNPEKDFESYFLLTIGNPLGLRQEDINVKVYNSSIFVNDCTFFYEEGYVTIDKEGYLNQTNVADSFMPVFNQTLYDEYRNASLTQNFHFTKTFLAVFEYPDRFLNPKYNETYLDTLTAVNDIVAAHYLNGLDPNADPCSFNQEQVPVYVSVLGTRMSFGYIIIGVAFAVISLSALAAFAFTFFSPKERTRWILYTRDWRFTGYIASGEQMDKKSFKMYSKEMMVGDNASTAEHSGLKKMDSITLSQENKEE
ncbi:hypothetical protein K501DRAFT_273141 [Backusella circina FSU 941]|nr:hypothetical protein K501DRAFT_273141 [Backusella circina FSU 941]